jgi:hypothetical protein
MQDRYAGDANDFSKYLILRHAYASLQSESGQSPQIGVCWYLTHPDIVDADNTQKDGERIQYLLDESSWRKVADADLFANLAKLFVHEGAVKPENRSVTAIEMGDIFPTGTIFHSSSVPQDAEERKAWHAAALEKLDPAELVFVGPDNSVSEQSTQSVRGGKWASVPETLAFSTDVRSVAWISHPRVQRSVHHHREMAKLGAMVGRFCSVYQGHVGMHFLLSRQHDHVAADLQQLVRTGMSASWGMWRYADSTGATINMDAMLVPEESVECSIPDDTWNFQDAVLVNDTLLWKKRNPWLPIDQSVEFMFLKLAERRMVRVLFRPFDGDSNQEGLRPDRAKDNLADWAEFSKGASNEEVRALPALFRVVE